jgi:hypothetical protein
MGGMMALSGLLGLPLRMINRYEITRLEKSNGREEESRALNSNKEACDLL